MTAIRATTVLALLLLAVPAAGATAPTYDLRGPLEKPGSIVQTRTEVKMPDGVFTSEDGGELIRGRISREGVTVRETEIVQTDGEQRTMFKRRTAEDWIKYRFERDGFDPFEGTDDDPLVSTTVLFERTDEGWRRTLLGGTPTPEQSALLSKPYDEVEVYPAKPVAVGTSWVIEGTKLAQLFGLGDALSADGKATYTLERVTEEGGERRAVISYRLELRARQLDENRVPNETSLGGSGRIQRSLTTYLDLSDRFSGQRTWAATVPLDKGGTSKRTEASAIEVTEAARPVAAGARAVVVRRGTDRQAAAAALPATSHETPPPPDRQRPASSGQKTCQGFALGCSLRTDINCSFGAGCFASSQCTGSPLGGCFGKSQFSCATTSGCFWNAWSKSCSGVLTCAGKGNFQCSATPGCRWQSTCTGNATPCSALDSGRCALQPGCFLR